MTRHASLLTDTDDDSFWKDEASLVAEGTPDVQPRVFDLEERTARFGEAVIDFAKLIPHGPLTDRLIGQLVGCGTSVGANYSEADDAVSKKSILSKHQHVPKGVSRSETFCAHGCASGAEVEGRRAPPLAGSERAKSHLLENLPE
jgi:hypothetical protein